MPQTEEHCVPAGSEDSDIRITDWSPQSITRLRNLALNQLPMMVSLKGNSKNENGLYEVYMYDTTNDKDIFMNQLLVDEKLAFSKVFSKNSK